MVNLKAESAAKYLKYFLILVSLHSLAVGAGLIILPGEMMKDFGYGTIDENFFRVQGGVFHIVMVVAYMMAALKLEKNGCMTKFAIIAKFMAAVFLFAYYFFVDPIIVVLLSGVGDLLMAVIILYLYQLLIRKSV